MVTFLIALFSVILVLTCFFVVMLVLMQKPSSNAGMGAALGGGAAEQAFGGEATNVLTRGTIYAIIAFFLISFGLYLGSLYASGDRERDEEGEASLRDLQVAPTESDGAVITDGEDMVEEEEVIELDVAPPAEEDEVEIDTILDLGELDEQRD